MMPDQLAGAVSRMIDDSGLWEGNARASYRREALDYANGKTPDIPPAGENRSKVVSRDVADHIGLVTPGLTRIFFSTDRIAIYEPTRKEHEEYADQATDLVNYVVMKECGGYRHLRDTMEEACLLGNGIIKHWWDASVEYKVSEHTGQSEDQYRYLLSQPETEELSHETYPDPDWTEPDVPPEVMAAIEAASPEELAANGIDPAMFTAPMLHNVKIRRVVSTGRLRLEAVPDEEFIIDKKAKVVDEKCRFAAHRYQSTRTQLIKDGYDKAKVLEIPRWDNPDDVSDERDDIDDDEDESPDASTDLIEVHECYVLIDYDGDGMGERRRVVMAGGTGKRAMLANEEWDDDLPFSDLVPDPRPHARRGRGIFEALKDIQQIKTVGLRGCLDNMYQILYPQMGADENMLGEGGFDELLAPTWGGVVRTKGPPGNVLLPITFPNIIPQVQPMLDYMDMVAEKRTGLSQRTMAMDPDVLQNQSATAANIQQSAVHSKVEEYARNLADFGGLKRAFGCFLKLIVKHQDRAKTIRLRGKLVEVDPRAWDAGMDVTINVGLGTGSRDRDIAMLQAVAAKQEAVVMQMGPFNEYVNIGHLFDTYRKIAEAAGLRDVDSYFPNISQEQIAQIREQQKQAGPPPDPKMVEAQTRIQIEQVKAQANAALQEQKAVSDAALKQRQSEMDARLEQQRINAEIAMKQRENAIDLAFRKQMQDAEIAFMHEKALLDAQLREKEMMLEAALTREANRMNAAVAARQADTNIRGANA